MNTTEENVSAKTIDSCNELLRGELSAIETYSLVIHRFGEDKTTQALEVIRKRHIDSANALRMSIHDLGGEPDTNSGAWGNFAKTLQSAANLIGEESAVSILERGEQYGLSEYKKALEKNWVALEVKSLIQSSLLPRQEEHLILLADLHEGRV